MKWFLAEFKEGLSKRDYYFWLSIHDVRARYRRTALGQVWITLSVAIFIIAIGFFYSGILNVPGETYLPALAIAYVVWYSTANLINGGTNIMIEAAPTLLQIKIPLVTISMRLVMREAFVFLHNIPIVIMACIIFGTVPNWLFIPNFLLAIVALAIFGILIGTSIGILALRYRDIPPIISSFTTILFFLSPIIWRTQDVPPNFEFVFMINPAAALIELVRRPFTDIPVEPWIFINLACTLMILLIMSFWGLRAARGKVTYWA